MKIFQQQQQQSVYFIVVKRCLSLWINGRLVRNQWNIITWKRRFLIHLNTGDITDKDYANAKRVCKDFEIKKLGKYHDLNV